MNELEVKMKAISCALACIRGESGGYDDVEKSDSIKTLQKMYDDYMIEFQKVEFQKAI